MRLFEVFSTVVLDLHTTGNSAVTEFINIRYASLDSE